MGVTTEFYPGHGGAQLALHRMGQGRPLILLHGLFSNAEMNWIKWGHGALLAQAGFECLMPDLRAHGQSAAPHEAEAYPADVLALDLVALIERELHFSGLAVSTR
jgi:pimeloyl-ACP methyl ester carboxylesterase